MLLLLRISSIQVQGKSVAEYLDNEKYCGKYCAKVLTKSLHLTRESPYQQSFGLVHTKLRNRLTNDRVIKLVRTYCYLRDKSADDQDDLELILQIQELPEEAVQVD